MAQQVAQDDNVRLHISCMLVTIVRVGMQVACDMQVVTNLHDFAWKEALSGPHKLPPDAIELVLSYDGKPVYAIMCKTYAHLLSSPLLNQFADSFKVCLAACVPASLDASCLPICIGWCTYQGRTTAAKHFPGSQLLGTPQVIECTENSI